MRGALSELDANPASADLEPLPWDPYAKVHQQIRKLDDCGNWDGAVALATGTGAESGNATFSSFDTSSDAAALLAEQEDRLPARRRRRLVDRSPRSSRSWPGSSPRCLRWWGVALRLEEYR